MTDVTDHSAPDVGQPAALARWWWARLPARASRLSFLLPQLMTDGEWVAALRATAAYAPPVALVLGLLIGWLQPGFVTLPTESLPLLAMMVGLGAASGCLGLWFLTGFAIGDFFLATPFFGERLRIGGWSEVAGLDHLWRVRPGQIVGYLVLAVGIVVLPLVVKLVVADMLLRIRRLSWDLLPYLMAGIGGLLLAGTVFVWSHAAAPLLRPRFTWFGTAPSYAAIGPLQETAWVLALVAGLAFAGRFVVQAAMARNDDMLDHASMLAYEYEQRMPDDLPWTERLPWGVRTAVMIVVVLAVAGGIIETWPGRAGAALVLLLIALARSPYVPRGVVRRWRLVARVPLLVRLVVIGVVARLGVEYALAQAGTRPTSWATLVLPAMAALVVALILLPPVDPFDQPSAQEPGQEPDSPAPDPAGEGTGA